MPLSSGQPPKEGASRFEDGPLRKSRPPDAKSRRASMRLKVRRNRGRFHSIALVFRVMTSSSACITTAERVSSSVQSWIGTLPSPCLKLQPVGSPLSHMVPSGAEKPL